MTQEDRQLLLKDLCMRLPYGIKFHYTKHPQIYMDQDYDGTAIGYYCNLIVTKDKDFCVDRCKLYLRPMSSMTEGEWKEYQTLKMTDWVEGDINGVFINAGTITDWLNKYHFDYRGLIPKGLAIAVTEENNPYKK